MSADSAVFPVPLDINYSGSDSLWDDLGGLFDFPAGFLERGMDMPAASDQSAWSGMGDLGLGISSRF